jgi:hypothetical protein
MSLSSTNRPLEISLHLKLVKHELKFNKPPELFELLSREGKSNNYLSLIMSVEWTPTFALSAILDKEKLISCCVDSTLLKVRSLTRFEL